jgi:pimeloyl-ACP methyl ester carboxylesterase
VAEDLRHDFHIIAPDLRGHGDSQWMIGGSYNQIDYVYDVAQLLRQTEMNPVTIVAHSLGGGIALLYAGLFPETVKRLVVIEGLGPPPDLVKQRIEQPVADRLHWWINDLRKLSGRMPRRYPTLEDAYERMQTENPHLTEAQARHLTIHGSNQNEDGTYSWKFDNYVRTFPPVGLDFHQQHELWARITCPTLLIRGTESWASDPLKDGRAGHFQDARVENVAKAGHWVHHDRLDEFLRITREFLAE